MAQALSQIQGSISFLKPMPKVQPVGTSDADAATAEAARQSYANEQAGGRSSTDVSGMNERLKAQQGRALMNNGASSSLGM